MKTAPLQPAGKVALPADWPRPIHAAAFHGTAGDFVRTIEPHTEADPVAVLAQTLAAFGSIIGRSGCFEVEADIHYCNLYVALVGPTGKARKGVSFSHSKAALLDADEDWVRGCVKTGLSTGEGLLHAVRDGRGEDGGVEDKRLLAVEPEFASLLRHMERQGNILSSQLRQLWDGPAVCETLTRSNPVKATGAHVSLIGHVTAEELRRYLSSTEMANGFGNRFIWLAARRSKLLPEGGRVPPDPMRRLRARFRDAVMFARRQGAIAFDDEARRRWHEIYPRLSEGRPGLSGAMLGRAEAQVRRLATVYSLIDQSPNCRLEHLQAALALWAYSQRSVTFIFGEATGDPTADAIREALREKPGDGLSRTEISRMFSGNRARAEIDRALGVLKSAGLAHGRKSSTGGRDEERWYAGPTKETKQTK